jgi:hypothetical protein
MLKYCFLTLMCKIFLKLCIKSNSQQNKYFSEINRYRAFPVIILKRLNFINIIKINTMSSITFMPGNAHFVREIEDCFVYKFENKKRT